MYLGEPNIQPTLFPFPPNLYPHLSISKINLIVPDTNDGYNPSITPYFIGKDRWENPHLDLVIPRAPKIAPFDLIILI